MSLKNPVIIIGMHRSGTSLVAKVLEKSGIFMGVLKDHNYEAIHFLSLNQQTLWAAGGSWLEPVVPDPIYWKTMPAKALYDEHFKLNTRWQKLRYHWISQSWGWKDPRNTFTLPMWLSLFPKAKVIHVMRDREEVSRSLMTRNRKKGEVFDSRLNDPEFNLALVDAYHRQGRSYQPILGDRYHEIEYNRIIGLEGKTIKGLEEFTGRKLAPGFKHFVRH